MNQLNIEAVFRTANMMLMRVQDISVENLKF